MCFKMYYTFPSLNVFVNIVLPIFMRKILIFKLANFIYSRYGCYFKIK